MFDVSGAAGALTLCCTAAFDDEGTGAAREGDMLREGTSDEDVDNGEGVLLSVRREFGATLGDRREVTPKCKNKHTKMFKPLHSNIINLKFKKKPVFTFLSALTLNFGQSTEEVCRTHIHLGEEVK